MKDTGISKETESLQLQSPNELFGVCPFVTAQRLLQGKWAILIMHHLEEGPVRFNELQRRMPKINHATLSRQLRQLDADGLIERIVHEAPSQKVEYRLTPIGLKIRPVLDAVRSWGQDYIAAMNKPQSASEEVSFVLNEGHRS